MTKKTETQFALLVAAFAADETMAKQVCSLLANGHIDEAVAKIMLGCVRDGNLRTEQQWRPYTIYPVQPSMPRWNTITVGNTTSGIYPSYSTGSTLTAAAKQISAA